MAARAFSAPAIAAIPATYGSASQHPAGTAAAVSTSHLTGHRAGHNIAEDTNPTVEEALTLPPRRSERSPRRCTSAWAP